VFSHSVGRDEASPRRIRRLVAVAAILPMLALSACSNNAAGSSAQPKIGDQLTFGAVASPPTLNPATGDPAYGSLYQWAYDPLIVMQPDGTFAPGLAEKWGYVGTGNKEYEITLRDGVKFSDGAVLDGQALKGFLDFERSQKAGTPAGLLASVDSVEVTGPLSVRLKLKQSDPGLTFAFAQAFGAGDVVSPKAIADPTSLDKGTAGAGPYMLDATQTVTPLSRTRITGTRIDSTGSKSTCGSSRMLHPWSRQLRPGRSRHPWVTPRPCRPPRAPG